MNKYVAAFLFFISVSLSCFAQQEFGGIGAQLFLDTMGGHTMPCINGLVANSSADEHLKVTDFIIKVNGVSCLDKSIQDVVALIRGEVGTTVKITVADTKEGKNPREYDLDRRSIRTNTPNTPAPATAPDPIAAFNTQCEGEVAQMKKQGKTIIKTFPSECGNYFFNFDAEKETYHIKVWTITDVSAQKFSITARVFDNANEAAATQILLYNALVSKELKYGILEGTATFNKSCIGVVNVQPVDDEKKCKAMYVVIYK